MAREEDRDTAAPRAQHGDAMLNLDFVLWEMQRTEELQVIVRNIQFRSLNSLALCDPQELRG